ncbi:MAG: VOC family protein, partial [Comamonadaceae bacterium]
LNKRLDAVKWDMLNEWSVTKRAPKHGAFVHAREFEQ